MFSSSCNPDAYGVVDVGVSVMVGVGAGSGVPGIAVGCVVMSGVASGSGVNVGGMRSVTKTRGAGGTRVTPSGSENVGSSSYVPGPNPRTLITPSNCVPDNASSCSDDPVTVTDTIPGLSDASKPSLMPITCTDAGTVTETVG